MRPPKHGHDRANVRQHAHQRWTCNVKAIRSHTRDLTTNGGRRREWLSSADYHPPSVPMSGHASV